MYQQLPKGSAVGIENLRRGLIGSKNQFLLSWKYFPCMSSKIGAYDALESLEKQAGARRNNFGIKGCLAGGRTGPGREEKQGIL